MAKGLDWDSRIGRRLRLRDLHVLFAVVEHGSMSAAGTHLSMSQSAVSQAIAALEDALKVRLLDRTARGVEPTIYADAIMRRGTIVFDELRSGIKDIEFLAEPRIPVGLHRLKVRRSRTKPQPRRHVIRRSSRV
jgi:DNA-binding transcriptional LysR family regulator